MRMMVMPVVRVAGEDGALDGRRPPPAGQERCVDVDAAQARDRERGGGQDQPECGDHHHVGGLRREARLRFGIA